MDVVGTEAEKLGRGLNEEGFDVNLQATGAGFWAAG